MSDLTTADLDTLASLARELLPDHDASVKRIPHKPGYWLCYESLGVKQQVYLGQRIDSANRFMVFYTNALLRIQRESAAQEDSK